MYGCPGRFALGAAHAVLVERDERFLYRRLHLLRGHDSTAARFARARAINARTRSGRHNCSSFRGGTTQ